MFRRTAPAALLLLCACASSSEGRDPCTDCSLSDANNFTYSSALDIGVLPAAALTDDHIDWSGLTRDVHGHPVDLSADISSARLIAFRDMTPEDVTEGLANDNLAQADVTLFVMCDPTQPSCSLGQFGLLGNPVDVPSYFAEGSATWLLALMSDVEPGAAAFAFLSPETGAADTVRIDSDTSALDATVDFLSLRSVLVPEGEPAVTVGWSALTRDGLGNDLSLQMLDEVFVGRYDLSRGALEARVFDLESLAVESWEAPIAGQLSVRLDTLAGDRPFPGADAESTWLLALRCSTCTNPTPRFVTFLEGAPEGGAP
jgi:hypothetical protein